jgi:hypothetical protein
MPVCRRIAQHTRRRGIGSAPSAGVGQTRQHADPAPNCQANPSPIPQFLCTERPSPLAAGAAKIMLLAGTAARVARAPPAPQTDTCGARCMRQPPAAASRTWRRRPSFPHAVSRFLFLFLFSSGSRSSAGHPPPPPRSRRRARWWAPVTVSRSGSSQLNAAAPFLTVTISCTCRVLGTPARPTAAGNRPRRAGHAGRPEMVL